MAARTLRELARRLEAGEYDRVDISQMCPMQSVAGPDGFRLSAPLPVLVVQIVAWRSEGPTVVGGGPTVVGSPTVVGEVDYAKEKDGSSHSVLLSPNGDLRAAG